VQGFPNEHSWRPKIRVHRRAAELEEFLVLHSTGDDENGEKSGNAGGGCPRSEERRGGKHRTTGSRYYIQPQSVFSRRGSN
jgi:hypothetical protein